MRLALRIAAAILALLLLVLIAVLAVLQTGAGARLAARVLESIGSTPGEMELRVGRLAPGLPFRLALSGLSIADKEGEWLAVERIEVRWRPLELLRGRLGIHEASAGGIRLSRLPEGAPEPEEKDAGFALPSLPLDLTVDRFALDDVVIGAAVAGEEVHLRAAGEVGAWRDGQLRTDAEIVRTNGVGGSARLALRWQPTGEQLSVDLHADEPEGGRLGSLLGLAGRPPVRLSFTGGGPITGWEGRLDGAVGDAIGIVAGIASEKAEDGIRVGVSGRAQVAALLPEGARALAADGIDFAGSFRRPEAGALMIETAEVGVGGARLAANGGLDLADERFADMRLTLSVADAAALAPLLAPAGLAAAGIRVRLTGPWTTPVAELAADIADLRVADATVGRSTLQGVLTSGADGRYQADADATFTGVRAGGSDIDALLGAPPNLRLRSLFDPEGNTLAFERIELLTPALSAEGRGRYALSSGDGRASLRASVPSLAALASLSGLDMAGRAALAADARLAAGSLTAGLGLAADELRSGIPAADALIGPAPTLRAALRTDPATGALRLHDLVLTGQGMRATAAATLQDQAVSAEYHVGIPDVASVAAASGLAASGTIALDGTLSGPASDPHAKAALTLADGHVADVVASPVRIEVSADSVISRPRGLLTATASAAGEVLRLAVPFAREAAGRLRLGPIDGSGAGARLSGDLSLPQESGAIIGALSLRTGGEGRSVALAGHRLDGTAEVRLALADRNGEQTMDIDGSGHSLALATPHGPVGSAESLSLRARLAGTAEPRGEIVLNVVRPTAGGTSLAGIDARVEGSRESARYDVTARLAEDPAEAVQARGTFAHEDGRTRITLASLDGHAGGHRLDLRRPLTVTLADGETVVDALDLAVGDGTISGGGRTGPAGSQGRLLLSRLPLSLANALRPGLSIEGMLDGDASVRSEGEDLAGRLTLNLSGVRAAAMSQAPPLEASATASLGGGMATAEIRVPRLGGSPLAFHASVPASVDARTLAVEVSEQAPLRGRLTWAGSLARLWELLPLPEQRLTGEANVDLALAGTVSAPELIGEAGLVNGRYEHFIAATVIDGLSLQARSTGSGAIALSLRGNDGASGTIAGDGRIALAGGTAPLVELVVTFAEATMVRRDDVTATLSGAMTFRQDEGASLSGEMTSDRMEIRLVDRLPPSVVVLDVTEINLPPEHAPRRSEPAPAAAGPAIALDIAMKLPRRVFVRGRGLESEWEGDLRVSGTSADPRIVGTVAVRSGTFDFAGKRFALETGEIGFTGGKPINPTLNVRATRTTPELTAVIRVIGTALEPEIELTSTPALPESEILSRVLFDKAVAKLGPVEAAQLAMALDTLASGESMSEDALSFVRNLLGLDVLTIEPGQEEGEGPAVGVGRYVAEGVYVGARQGATDESTAGTVEIEVLPGLAIESELSDSTEGTTGALGLRWKWDY